MIIINHQINQEASEIKSKLKISKIKEWDKLVMIGKKIGEFYF
jgi:hypothetical protein